MNEKSQRRFLNPEKFFKIEGNDVGAGDGVQLCSGEVDKHNRGQVIKVNITDNLCLTAHSPDTCSEQHFTSMVFLLKTH